MMLTVNKVKELKYMTARQFFGTYIPVALQAAKGELQGTCAVRVYGPGGGAWTIDLANRSVSVGCQEHVTASWDISAENLDRIFRGREVDESDPMYRIAGDPKVFATLATVVEPSFLQRRAA